MFPMLVTLLGMDNEAKLLQPENAEFPILVTLLGIVTEGSALHPANTLSSIDVKVFGSDRKLRLLQP